MSRRICRLCGNEIAGTSCLCWQELVDDEELKAESKQEIENDDKALDSKIESDEKNL